MKDFFKKYKLIVFLAFLVFILIFVRIYFGGKNNNENNLVEIKPTPTAIFPNPQTVKLSDLRKMDEATLKKYLNSLTEEQLNNLPEDNPDYSLDYLLPYESETFIVEKYLRSNVLLVKAKGNDLEKSKSDFEKWLQQNQDESNPQTVVWDK